MKKLIILLSLATFLNASCFKAIDDIAINAQKIRLTAKELGWEVGKAKSFVVAGIIKSKQKLFPDAEIKVCIEERDGDLKFIMYANSVEKDTPKWHFLTASKTGWF